VTGDQLPDDPFRSSLGPRFDTFSDASLLWATLLELSVEDAGRAVRALDRDDLRALVLERIITARLRVDFGRDGTIGFERPEPEPGDDEPEGGSA
jgi:hypothetical protein